MNCQTIHIIALTVLAVLSSQADVLELKDVKTLTGKYVGGSMKGQPVVFQSF